MNKIKLMYDLVNTMKEKETLKGVLKAEGKKDQVELFSLVNDFEKSMSNGQSKAKIKVELDYQGKKVKHESSTEFDQNGCGRQMFMRQHGHFHSHKHHFGPGEMQCRGIKDKLSRLAYVLKILNDIKVDELEDQNQLLSLKINDISESMKCAIHEKMKYKMEHKANCHHSFMKEFMNMDTANIELSILVNKNKEIEKIFVKVDGEQKDEMNEKHEMNLSAELQFTY